MVSLQSTARDRLERVRPGAYVRADEWRAADARERHLVKVRAAGRAITDRAVFSHESAAAVHGIPVITGWPDQVHASFDGTNGMSTRSGVIWSRARWDAGDVVDLGRLRVTSPRRTAIDLARTGPFAQGVTALDHVLASGVEPEELSSWMVDQPRARGIARLRRAAGIARGMSESPLESLSLARFAELGTPAPVQQHELTIGPNRYRLDFFWPEHGVVGEADGRLKYQSRDELWREKRREDDIRRTVRAFIRWSWSDAWTVTPLRDLLVGAGIPSV